MPPGVKEQLGLKDPKNPNHDPKTNTGSTEQADKFKADYQASAGKINESLQYTAAYAQQSKHDPHAAKRDTLCQAYQVALGKIDPTNPSVAKGAIDQVLSTAKQLQTTTETLKTTTEKAYNAWTARHSDLETLTNQVREMVDWGHEKAAPLQQVLDVINSKSKERAYEEALTALEQTLSKAAPIYADYQKQKAAQEEYEPALQALQPRLDQAKTCTFKALVTMQQDLSSAADQMQQAADKKDYVTALAQLRTLEGNVAAFETKLAEIEAKKQEYEAARQALDPKLGEASTSQFKSLADLDQQIADLTTRTDAAASEEDYEQAVTLVGELSTKVEEKITRAKEIEAKKQEYEAARQALDPKLGEASTCQFKSLAEFDQQIADLTTRTDAAASEEDYEQAVTLVNELTTKVDEKLARVVELEAKKAEYETARAGVDPKIAEAASSHPYKALDELNQQITDLTTRTDTAATDEKYDEAVTLVGDLTAKVDEKLAKIVALEAKKAEYETARTQLDPKLTEASTSKFEVLAELDQKIADLTTRTDTAATEENYEEAVTLVGELGTAVDEKLTKVAELEAKKAEYETARAALDPKLAEASSCKFEELAELDQKIADLTSQTDAAAAKQDYEQAVTLVGDLTAAVDEKLAKTAEVEAYKAARAALDPKLGQASTCKHEELAKLDEEIASLTAKMDQAAAAKDYKTATDIANQLSGKVDTKLSEEGRLDRKIVGAAQKERADKKLESLDEATRKRYNDLANNAKSPEEMDYLSKALASGHSIDDIEAFAKKINGKDKEWLQNNLKLTGNTTGKGVKQQWGDSCNATTVQALKGELDPLYSLKLHEENADVTDVDESDGTKKNAKLAAEQKAMLESGYTGGVTGGSAGVAANRVGGTGGQGRWADDLENNMSDSTGVKYTTKLVDDGGTYKVDDAVKDVDAGLKKGHPVPLVVGAGNKNFQHYVLVTGKNPGPPESWTIHDPWDGVTVTRSVQDIKDGKLNVANCTRITGLDNPATKE